METDLDNIVTDSGYTRGELNEAFQKVRNAEHWKRPTRAINVETEEEAIRISAAVTYFTGGVPFYYQQKNGKWHVSKTEGYYYHIGA